jgi:hypothetical protein
MFNILNALVLVVIGRGVDFLFPVKPAAHYTGNFGGDALSECDWQEIGNNAMWMALGQIE